MYKNAWAKVSLLTLNLLISVSFGQVVMNNNDAGADSLRDVLTNAGNNDTITFDASLSGQTITLASDLQQIAVRNLTIDASTLVQPVTIDADGNRLLSHTGNGRLTLRNLVLTGGTGTNLTGRFFGGGAYSAGDIIIEDSVVRGNAVARDGGGLFSGRNMTIRNSVISDNTAIDDGAGAYSEDNLTVENSTISNNFANDPTNNLTSSGGGLTVEGNLTITNSVVSGNRADRGGGADTENRVTITSSTFSDNQAAEQDGGGLRSRQNRRVRITDSTFTGNQAAVNGGAIYSERRLDIENSTLRDNRAGERGGAVHMLTQGRLTIRASIVSNNVATANDGGAIYSERRVDIENSTLNQNQAGDHGGAVYIITAGRLTILASTLNGNEATGDDGGAIYSERNTTITDSTLSNNQSGNDGGALNVELNLEITSSIITGNQAADNGGGIHTDRNVTISNSLIAGNVAADRGGGLRNNSNRNVTLINTTVAGNRANIAGGGLWLANNIDITLSNTLVLGNDAGANDQLVVNLGRLTSNNSAADLADLTPAVDITRVFVAPQAPANAPTTAGDYRLLTGSPALDAGDDALALDTDGNALTVDLAGNPRIQNIVDIGAYEGGFERSSGSVINPNQDVQIRNGATLEAESITSGAIEPFYYGPFKRNETVVLELLVRNPGAKVLELGELTLPSFLTAAEPLPETLDTFASALLSLQVDTSQAGRFTGEISLASNDPDAFENPFTFDIVVTVTDTPANALEVLPGAPLEDITVTPGQQDVPVYSFRLNVPAGSVSVTLDAISLNVDGMAVLDEAETLTLYLDGGTRGERDRLDVPLATLTAFDSETNVVTFTIPERTLTPDVPLWFLLVADFE